MSSEKIAVVLSSVALLQSYAFSHHNPVDFLLKEEIKITGAVSRIDWVNPHVYIHIDSENEQGSTHTWSIESQSPLVLARFGWTRDSLSVGETVSFIVSPSRTQNEFVALGRRIFKQDGTSLKIEWDPELVRESIR